MDFTIRPVQMQDAPAINELRRMDGARENTLAIKSERLSATEDFLRALSDQDHVLVAEVRENDIFRLVGIAGLHINKMPRMRHSGGVGIMIHPAYQGKGIGRALLTALLDLADNWLKLVRIELTVFVDNQRAIQLYQSLGFEIEGTKKLGTIRNGTYADEYLMGRYNIG